MAGPTPEYPHVDFATDAVPDLHDVLADLRERHRVAPVRYHGKLAWRITRFDDLQQAFCLLYTSPSPRDQRPKL